MSALARYQLCIEIDAESESAARQCWIDDALEGATLTLVERVSPTEDARRHRIPSLPCPEGCEDGVIEVIDSSRVHSATIEPPYIQTACAACDDGEVYEWTCGACDESFHTTEQMPVNPESTTGWTCASCALEDEGHAGWGRLTRELFDGLREIDTLAVGGKHARTPFPSEVADDVRRAQSALRAAFERMRELAVAAHTQTERAA